MYPENNEMKICLRRMPVILQTLQTICIICRHQYMYINFQQTRVNIDQFKPFTQILFANNRKVHKFATNNSNFGKNGYLDMHHRITYMYINF